MPPPSAARFCVVAALLAGAPVLAGVHDYSVSVDAGLETIEVQACFHGAAPVRLEASSRRAGEYLHDVHTGRGDGRVPLSVDRGGIRTGALGDDACVHYRVAAARAVDQRVDRNGARTTDFLVLRSSWWLWLPADLDDGDDVAIRFRLPEGMAVSAPWPTPSPGVYRLGRTPASWPALVAFGRFTEQPVTVPGATLRLAVLPGEPAADPAAMAAWIGEAAGAVASLYGRFPVPSPQVLVVPVGARGEPVPWGQVLRGGMPAAHFFVDQSRPLAEFRADWTAAHELSHMLLPYLGSANAWLSEGFASYYQNVLRARAGMLEEREAWQKLHDGFQRGIRGTRGLTLSEASRNMRRDRAFMRVYWSGAAVALKADVAIRQETGGRESLATALADIAACCLPANRRWSARQLVDALDRATGTGVMARLYAKHVDDHRFPDLEAIYERLGLTVDSGRIVLDDTAEQAHIRGAIMGAPGRPPAPDARATR